MKHWFKYILFISLLAACQTTKEAEVPKDYPRMIGDIAYDEAIDTDDFKLCNKENMAVQYYAFSKLTGVKPHAEEKYEVDKIIRENYKLGKVKRESGLLRIRFMVNCKGESGRFRMIGMNKEYKAKEFHVSISDQLLYITKNLIKWSPFEVEGRKRDYYMYLSFKIEEGKIIEILP